MPVMLRGLLSNCTLFLDKLFIVFDDKLNTKTEFKLNFCFIFFYYFVTGSSKYPQIGLCQIFIFQRETYYI
ncbi:hypothetical protein Anas_11485 [Armadillidium nasatum]|uniref:Uncharacterized protein n=1 Tax=Armadillidium nasatum TaxID=96803 RepID=A0A5N5T8P3_9CRUS|nr:hypothetical protein Anas_11485 [Armadillidium nasatum]